MEEYPIKKYELSYKKNFAHINKDHPNVYNCLIFEQKSVVNFCVGMRQKNEKLVWVHLV